LFTEVAVAHTGRCAAWAAALATLIALGGCATPPAQLSDLQRITLPDVRQQDAQAVAHVVMLGEQHDAAQHQNLQRLTIDSLARQGRLAAVVLEMADRGRDTQGLSRDATEQAAQAALAWRDAGWPWKAYGPVVMQAIRLGIPVYGSNLPFSEMRDVMNDATWDQRVPDAVFATQKQAVADGHCGLLPESQLTPMARIQIARDHTMAKQISAVSRPGGVTLYIAGSAHTDLGLGVPIHLKSLTGTNNSKQAPIQITSIRLVADGRTGISPIDNGEADWHWHTDVLPARDYCAELKAQFKRGA